jgi:hypothetical protein
VSGIAVSSAAQRPARSCLPSTSGRVVPVTAKFLAGGSVRQPRRRNSRWAVRAAEPARALSARVPNAAVAAESYYLSVSYDL